MELKDIHISSLKGRRKSTTSLKVGRKHTAALKFRRKRTAALKVRRKRTPAIGPFPDRPFKGPLPPGPIPPHLLEPMPRPPIPPPSSFSEPAIFPRGFGLISYGRGGPPFERERFQGDLIHTGSSQRKKPAEKEKESGKESINLTIHIHNPKDLKRLTQKSVAIEKGKGNLETIKEIQLNKELSKRKMNTRPSASKRLTFLDPRERIEKEKAVLSLKNENSLFQNIERKQVPALAKAIPNVQTNRNRPLNRNPGRLPLRLSEIEPENRDVLRVKQSQSSFYLQMPSPKSLYLRNEGLLHSNLRNPNQHLQANKIARNHFERPNQISPLGLQNVKEVHSNKLRQLRAPVVSHKGANSNNRIKPGLFGVQSANVEINSPQEPRGNYIGSELPSESIVKTALAGEKKHLKSVEYPSKPDIIVKDLNAPYKTSNAPRNVNGPYINTQLNNNQNVPQPFSGHINKRKLNENFPEIKSELNTVDISPSATALPSQNTYNQMLLSLMIIMLQQQQIEKVRERMNGKGNVPYSQHRNQLPYLQSIPPIPYRTILPYQPSVSPIPYLTLPPLQQSINSNQLRSPNLEREIVHPSNQQSGKSSLALQRERLINHLNGPMQSKQTQLASSIAKKHMDQVNVKSSKHHLTKGGFSFRRLQNNAQQTNELLPNNVHDQVSPLQQKDYSNSANLLSQDQLQNQNIQAKASAFEYPNELNVMPPTYSQKQGNVLLLRSNPIDKSAHIAPSKDILFKGSQASSSKIMSHNAATLGHGTSQNQHSSQQHKMSQVNGQTGNNYQPSISDNIAGHQLRTINGASVPETASISVLASSFPKQNTQVQGSNTYKPKGLVLDVTDIKGKDALLQGNPTDVFQQTGGVVRNIPQNDLNSKLDRLLALFEKQDASSTNANSAHKSYSVKLPPASLKRTNPQLYEEILEQNAEQTGSQHEL